MNSLKERLTDLCGRPIESASDQTLRAALTTLVRERAEAEAQPAIGRKLYYLSAEFLVGRLLTNNLINLGLYDEVNRLLNRAGKSLSELESLEPEPGLGNGGLGRLAVCLMDSLASLNLPADGVGLLYHCGLFRQEFVNGLQQETPDRWLHDCGWIERTDTVYPVSLAGQTLQARLWRLAVTGYEGRTNYLNLFDPDSVDESIIGEGIAFPKEDIARNLTLFLYPDDSDQAGRILRLYQQAFMVSAAAQLILNECAVRGCTGRDLPAFAAVQINDTHPSLIIPELILRLQETGISFEEAAEIVTHTCAYTNHTILAEALETWRMQELETVVPHLVPVIRALDGLARSRTNDESVAVIDRSDVVHMAHMDIHFTHSTNGVAQLHTEILKSSELRAFHALYPERFNNKTNGVTFRRWLIGCNPGLTAKLDKLIGPDYRRDAAGLERLLAFSDDETALRSIARVKAENKKRLAEWLQRTQGVSVNPRAMFSIQAKRLHEYKRQQLNLLFLIHMLLELREGRKLPVPLVSMFGAKAAPAYTIAKDIIHALNVLARVVEGDPAAAGQLQIVFIENYNVTAAEKLIPACDLSEQISLAGKEASGTGNMKFMLNGAVTIGTLDGANVEISRLVGRENIYLFGQTASQVMRRYETGDYSAREWYENDFNLRRAVDFLLSGEMLKYGQYDSLFRLKSELVGKDWFQTLPDFSAYLVRKQQAMADYALRPLDWQRKCLMNIAHAGFFSSDRTVAEYNRDIWRLGNPSEA